VSRVLDALKQVDRTPPKVETGRVTPRLSASVRNAALSSEQYANAAVDAIPPVLFSVPPYNAPSVQPLFSADPETQQTENPQSRSKIDPLALVDVIAETIRTANSEELAKEATPLAPKPTTGEMQIESDLNDTIRSKPFRTLYESIVHDTQTIANPIIAILSIDEDVITSTAVARVAALKAHASNDPVLMIDAHRGAQLSGQFDATSRPGLMDTLGHPDSPDQVVNATSNHLVDLISFGQAAVGLLPPSQRMIEQLQSFRTKYSATFIDAGSSQEPLSIAASRAADVTYIAINLARTPAEQAVASVKRLRAAGVKLAGSIVIGESL
jgi:hypothetical protein